jgi:hypothetical protein
MVLFVLLAASATCSCSAYSIPTFAKMAHIATLENNPTAFARGQAKSSAFFPLWFFIVIQIKLFIHIGEGIINTFVLEIENNNDWK